MWVIFFILKRPVAFLPSMALLPLGIIAGWLPFTFAGIGARDAALLGLLSAKIGAEHATAFALISTIRILAPGIIGLPFFYKQLSKLRNRN
ncbi:UPF0104 family protein, partial [Candidatus Margulisiibacteriota bacterium]